MSIRPQGIADNLLSIVIITRNEARNVGRCIESALNVAARLPGTAIMLVDSASSDETINIARKYPITIVQLQSHWRLSPSAGRYLGTLNTMGKYILFLDGDTEVFPDWILQALEFLHQHPEVAGTDGALDTVYIDERGQSIREVVHRIRVSKASEVKSLGGNSLYRRAALERAGTFNPYLVSWEETELALRLRRIGYILWRFASPMARHFSLCRNTRQEGIRRFRAGFYPKCGRTLRATVKNGLAGQFILEFLLNYAILGGYLLLGLALFVVALAGQGKWLLAWLVTSVAAFAAYSVHKSNPREAFDALLVRLMVIYGLILGFITGGKDVDPYPTDVIVVQCQTEVTPKQVSHPVNVHAVVVGTEWQNENQNQAQGGSSNCG